MLIVILSNITNSVHLPLGSPEYSCYLELFTIFIYKKKKILRRNGFDMIIAYRMFTALCIIIVNTTPRPASDGNRTHAALPRTSRYIPFTFPHTPWPLEMPQVYFWKGKTPTCSNIHTVITVQHLALL